MNDNEMNAQECTEQIITQLENTLDQRDKKIAFLKAEISTINNELSRKEIELNQANAELNILKRRMSEGVQSLLQSIEDF